MTVETSPRTGPAISRVEHHDVAAHEAAVTKIVEEHVQARHERYERIAELKRRASAPLVKLLESDPDAVAAMRALSDELSVPRRIVPDEQRRTVAADTRGGGGVLPALHAGINVLSLPYDFEITAPTFGGSATSRASRLDGTFGFDIPTDHDGTRVATAGLGVTFTSNVTGVMHIRPLWRYEYDWSTYELGQPAASTGTAYATVTDANTGALMGTRTVPLWHEENTGAGFDSGYVEPWGLALDILIHQGQLCTLSLTCSGYCDSDFILGFLLSRANGRLAMSSSFVVVEM